MREGKKTVTIERGTRVIERQHICGRKTCRCRTEGRLHPPVLELRDGATISYLGRSFQESRPNLPVLVEAELIAKGDLPEEEEVLEVVAALRRATAPLTASRAVLREGGLADGDVLVLPRPVITRLASGERTAVVALPTRSADQRKLVAVVRSLLSSCDASEGLGASVRLRRRVGRDAARPLLPLRDYGDTRLAVFSAPATCDLLTALLRLSDKDVLDGAGASGRHEAADGKQDARTSEVTLPLILIANDVRQPAGRLRLDRIDKAAVAILNPALATAEVQTVVPFELCRRFTPSGQETPTSTPQLEDGAYAADE